MSRIVKPEPMRTSSAGRPRTWLDEVAGGPLAAAAVRFLNSLGLDASTPPSGAVGLRLLLRSMETQLSDDRVDDELEFIEGAGAFLGLLLLKGLGGEHQQHRERHLLRLGRFGLFDPFEAVSTCLGEARIDQALVDAISTAEDEAQGRAGFGRLAVLFRERLGQERPELALISQHGPELQLEHRHTGDTVVVDLDRTHRATNGASAATLHKALRELVGLIPGAGDSAGMAWEDAKPRLRPRLQSAAFTAALPSELQGKIPSVPITDGLQAALVLDCGDRFRYVTSNEIQDWCVGLSTALDQSFTNLGHRTDMSRFDVIAKSAGTLISSRHGDGCDAARILLPEVQALLRRALGGQVVVGMPHRDMLMATSSNDTDAIRELRSQVENAAARAPHAISSALFRLCTDAGGRLVRC